MYSQHRSTRGYVPVEFFHGIGDLTDQDQVKEIQGSLYFDPRDVPAPSPTARSRPPISQIKSRTKSAA